MKRKLHLTLLPLIILVLRISAYSQGYTFSMTNTQNFEYLENATTVNNTMWGYEVYSIPIGFNILFFDSYIDTLFVYENHPWMLTSTDLENTQAINPFGTTLIDRGEGTSTSESRISYKHLNLPGNRICIIEWKNFGFDGDFWCYEVSTDYVNFQIWLYEADNRIEYHYGPQHITNFTCSFWGESGPFVSLIPWMNFEEDLLSDSTLWLSGVYTNPVLNMSNDPGYLTGTIQDGTVYTFENVLTSSENVAKEVFKIFPNPVDDHATLLLKDVDELCNIEIYNVNGIPEIEFSSLFVDGSYHVFQLQALNLALNC